MRWVGRFVLRKFIIKTNKRETCNSKRRPGSNQTMRGLRPRVEMQDVSYETYKGITANGRKANAETLRMIHAEQEM